MDADFAIADKVRRKVNCGVLSGVGPDFSPDFSPDLLPIEKRSAENHAPPCQNAARRGNIFFH
jgi:hypothetical protein